MRNFSFIIITVLISCTEKPYKNELDYFSNLKFTIDTLLIDPGNELIYLKNDILSADKTMDDKYLFNFNWNDHTLEKINLDDLKLEEKLPFEKEGPNGTGQFMGKITVHNESQFTVGDMNRTELFSLDGEKLMTVRYENFSLGWEFGEEIIPSPVLDKDANRLYVLTDQIVDESYIFGILHLDNYEISRMPLETFEDLYNYKFTLQVGMSSVSIGPTVRVERFGTKVILSNQITSALMVYDTELDSLFMKTYSSQLIANEKVKTYKTVHEIEEALEAEYTKFLQEINFLPPFWDEKNQIFYRFSYQEMPSEPEIDEHIKSRIYLTALDKELNLKGEILVPQLTKIPANAFFRQFPKHFAKDGKIWIYENINDEMGFVVLTMFR